MNPSDPLTLRHLGEDGLLSLIGTMLRRQTEGLPLGTGDDVAITEPTNSRQVWTLDSMVEGTHFRWWNHELATPELLAWKLLASNLSDLNSKGATPRWALLSLGVPGSAGTATLEAFYRGLEAGLLRTGTRLLGGDTVRSPQWSLTLALVGELPVGAAIASRDRVRPGHYLYVSGSPGEARAGLEIVERGLRIPRNHAEPLVRALLSPQPPLLLGPMLVSLFPDLAMMDLSDGIAADASRLASRSGVKLIIDPSAIPISESLEIAAKAMGRPAWELALEGGEDYELLFSTAVPPEVLVVQLCEAGRGDSPIRCIGRAEEGTGVWLKRGVSPLEPLSARPFQHFQ